MPVLIDEELELVLVFGAVVFEEWTGVCVDLVSGLDKSTDLFVVD